MPPTCSKNGLGVTDTPKELEGLYLVERHLIQKNLPFLKVRHKPRTRMKTMNDRVISVPIGDEDIIKNAKILQVTQCLYGIP